MYADPGDLARRIISDHMGEVARRFEIAIRRDLPDLADADLYWRAFFRIGVLAQTVTVGTLFEVISSGHCDPTNCESTIARMTAFVCAGLWLFSAGKGHRHALSIQTRAWEW